MHVCTCHDIHVQCILLHIFLSYFSLLNLQICNNQSNSIITIFITSLMWWFGGVVVITSALHAEGLGFEPQSNLLFAFVLVWIQTYFVGKVSCQTSYACKTYVSLLASRKRVRQAVECIVVPRPTPTSILARVTTTFYVGLYVSCLFNFVTYVNLPTLFTYFLGFDIHTSSFIFILNVFFIILYMYTYMQFLLTVITCKCVYTCTHTCSFVHVYMCTYVMDICKLGLVKCLVLISFISTYCWSHITPAGDFDVYNHIFISMQEDQRWTCRP